ncbi:mechanosensitive ion channel family protein [Psychrobacter urativorans]|uniref:mechanosensitive ion channel family protein n=1 Tax=Psychrobacter urativorans TaxID=45610 RepID=UPI001D12AA8D|nr:mechanosensitive ion channel family protein [Psychrobacter urativorans]
MNTHVKAVDRKDTSRYGSDSRDGADRNGLMSRVSMFIVALMLILLSLVFLAANANANTNTATHENSNSSVQKITKPDNIIDYAEQKIEDFKAEDIDVSKVAGDVFDPSEKNSAQQAGVLQGNSALTGDYNESYYPLTELNTGLPPLTESPNLSTPLATLEFFQSAIMKQQYDLAAYALNMNLMDSELQTSRSIELSRRLDFLLNKKQLYVFDRLPDRPDGLIEPLIGSSSSVRGIPRRSIQLGYIDYRERRVPIFIERVRIGDNAPVWVFSAQTVSNIDHLYEQYQPAPFESYLPTWMTLRFFGIAVWEFLALLTFFTVTMGLGWLLSTGVGKLIRWSASDVDDKNLEQRTVGRKSITDLITKLTVPLTFSISFSLVYTLVSGGFPYLDPVATATRPIIWIGLVLSTIWLGIRIINFFANRYQDLQIENLGEKEFDKYRRRSTYVSIFRRVFIFVMILGSIWNGLSEFTNLEGLGKTLLTSAGIAGAVIGIAAQPILGNIIAGMQVAVTQPIRIGDTVMMEGDWSTVEDLRYTYAVLKTWDERRLFVPMRHFVSEIIENWSHPEAHQTRLVYLYVDYGVKIDKVRQKFIEAVKAHELWDGVVEPGLTATSVTENNIKLLGTLSSDSADNAWILECDVREQMLGYLYDEQKAYLPTERLSFEDRSG